MRQYFSPRSIVFIFFILVHQWAYSQQALNDGQIADSLSSIRNQLNEMKSLKGIVHDSLRLELINKMALLSMETNKDTALHYAETALQEARSLQLKNVSAVFMHTIAAIHEYHKDFEKAEKNYLEWAEVRKIQNADEYRWSLQEMRRFYCVTRQEKKLGKIEEEWLAVLDHQLDQGHISPWLDWESATPQQSYVHSMKPVFTYLINHQYYFIAERSFKHMLQKCPDSYDDWRNDDNLYIQAESSMLTEEDTATLAVWYEHWYNTLEENGMSKEFIFETINRISQRYTSGFSGYVEFFDRFYPLMIHYAEKIGGDLTVHRLNSNGSRRYVSSLPVKIKINLFLLESCIKVNDDATLEKTYTETDKLINEYLSGKNSKKELLLILENAKSRSGDKDFIRWCDKKMKKLK